jgi:uncharacterized protein YwqG
MLSHDDIRRHAARAGHGRHADAQLALLRPFVRRRHASAPARGAPSTRLGGAPELAAGVEWPRWKGAPLAFVAQIALRDLAGATLDIDLPSDGLLSFFYDAEQSAWGFDPADEGAFRVLYAPPDAPLRSVEPPRELPEGATFPAVALSPVPSYSLPTGRRAGELLSLSNDERDAYWGLLDTLAQAVGGAMHQIGGHAAPIQEDMELECQLVTHGLYCGDPSGYQDPRAAALASGAQDWRLVLQVDSDDDAGMMWGDVGMLYFWMREEDMAARGFDRAWMIFQCS